MDLVIAPLELKLADTRTGGEPGTFSGYAAVFGNVDSHGDIIAPGAFKASLERRASQGRQHVPMHVQHAILGGDGLPIGVWKHVVEDDKGLKVEGKISGMETDAGRLHYARLKDGAYGGLSIGFRTTKSSQMKSDGGARRLVEAVDLHEISLVTDPSNAQAIIHEVKSRELATKATLAMPQVDKAASAVTAMMALHQTCLTGGNSPTSEQRTALFDHMQDVHEALTGKRLPDGMKTLRSAGEIKAALIDMGVPLERAEALAADAAMPVRPQTSGETKTAITELRDTLSAFRLPAFG